MAEYCWAQSVCNGDPGVAQGYLDSYGTDIRSGKPILDKARGCAARGMLRKALSVVEGELPKELADVKAVKEFTMFLRRESRPHRMISNALKRYGRKAGR